MIRIIFALVCLLGSIRDSHAQTQTSSAPPAAHATLPAAAALSPAQAQQALEVLQDASRRAQVTAVLQAIAKALPPAAPAGALPASPAVAALAAASSGGTKLQIPLAPDSVGAQLLLGASERLSTLSDELVQTTQTITDYPLLSRWVIHITTDPEARGQLLDTGWRLLVVLAAGLGVERLAQRLLVGARFRLERTEAASETVLAEPASVAAQNAGAGELSALGEPQTPAILLRRLPHALGRFALDLLPVLAIGIVGYALSGTALGADRVTRLVILAVLNAYLICRAVTCLTRMLVSPDSPSLRLVRISDKTARYIVRWVGRIVVVAVFGYALTEVGLLFGLYRVAHDALLKIVSLAVHAFLVVIVLESRRPVADLIRARSDATGLFAALRNRLAKVWHVIAIFYIVAFWLVYAFEIPNGLPRLVRFFAWSAVILTLVRVAIIAALGAIDRAMRLRPEMALRHPWLESRSR
jgi:moderate conductance mechanosensitive channel